jgi:hypothetical protein
MIHQGRSISHTFTYRSNLSHVFATPIPVIVNNHYIVFSIKPDCSYIAILYDDADDCHLVLNQHAFLECIVLAPETTVHG